VTSRDFDLPRLFTHEIMTFTEAQNVSIKMFERLGIPPRRSGNIIGTSQKPEVRQSWKWPIIIPNDLFIDSFGGTDYQC
jgi:hypothetical protein